MHKNFGYSNTTQIFLRWVNNRGAILCTSVATNPRNPQLTQSHRQHPMRIRQRRQTALCTDLRQRNRGRSLGFTRSKQSSIISTSTNVYNIYMYVYMYMYIYVCMCCMWHIQANISRYYEITLKSARSTYYNEPSLWRKSSQMKQTSMVKWQR